ncbi:Predicted GTP-binding protein MMR1 [Phaffia rhodozyma]|uniref:Guanine nucleotide-binding protein-like 1 n=1 Tax=Phaffia rhodozyma TaxID=264483 RepID=A0A0F7SUY2_PHARH|nr:Predicted GTP-binding protein MMR1 [Phaffia rhodozyma]
MAKRKPQSTKQRKAQLQEKRAIKRGDIDPPDKPKPFNTRKPNPGRIRETTANAPRSQQLVSKFLPLTPQYLANSKTLSLTLPLDRPLPDEISTFPIELISQSGLTKQLTVPRRPKWRYEMTKKEVEANEAGLFKKWLAGMDECVERWRKTEEKNESEEKAEIDGAGEDGKEDREVKSQQIRWPKSTTYFERNLEVYRQLWRTTEASPILLVLIDIRCPPLHFPPSMQDYISSLQPKKEVILILTKCDLVPEDVRTGWVQWCEKEWAEKWGWDVICLESYRREKRAQGTRSILKSHLPPASLSTLVSSLKRAHVRLLTPPPAVQADRKRLEQWSPKIRREIDWNSLLAEKDLEEPDPEPAKPVTDLGQDEHDAPQTREEADEEANLEYLTIGLIGQPNVGKSSLLNALVGKSKVRASKTPGKTKHLQTIFWTKEIRLADSPGLVLPSMTPFELQAISSILPISTIPALPSVIRLACQLMPLERVLGLKHEDEDKEKEMKDKKTWRPGSLVRGGRTKEEVWTTGMIMEGWALERGFLTAKAGRPDFNRAGNHILRSIAEARIPWSFRAPPVSSEVSRAGPSADVEVKTTSAEDRTGLLSTGRFKADPEGANGIWLGVREDNEDEEEEDYKESSEEEQLSEGEEGTSEEEEQEDEEDEEEVEVQQPVKKRGGFTSMFDALGVEEGEDESEGEDDDKTEDDIESEEEQEEDEEEDEEEKEEEKEEREEMITK